MICPVCGLELLHASKGNLVVIVLKMWEISRTAISTVSQKSCEIEDAVSAAERLTGIGNLIREGGF